MKKLKIATTSFIIPSDRINNIKFINKYIDNIELLYFEGKKFNDLPTPREINFFKNTNLSYTVHLPINIHYYDKIEKYIALFHNLDNISSFIMHSQYNKKIVKYIIDLQNKYKKDILIENTIFNLTQVKNFIRNEINICFDIGHILPYYNNYSIINFLNIYKKHIKYLHVYGSLDGKKHQSLKYLDNHLLALLIKFAIHNNITFCIEVFNINDLIESINILKCFLP